MEEAQLVFSVSKFAYKLSERQRGSRKVYAIDTGLRNAISVRFSPDLGKLVENVVALSLIHKYRELFYFSNKGECDFVFRENAKFHPLQVSFADLSSESVRRREIQGLMLALNPTLTVVVLSD